ncbi:MAG: diaminopimelate decarboxylase [Fusobacteria bacterium]|nr:diaminopimelate decarboxylase [Fusobacteriota bacterium]
MKLQGTMKINENGHLEIGGCDVVSLANNFGTPLVVIDEDQLTEICKDYYNNFTGKEDSLVLYASKAFLSPSILGIINKNGLGLDTVSGGELYMAYKSGFPMSKVFFHGNNKTDEEIKMAIEYGVGRIVLDNDFEIDHVNRVAIEQDKKVEVLLRITPGIDAHTHDFIKTGHIDSKFGFTLQNGDALAGVAKTANYSNLIFKGLHCHIGSQIFGTESFEHAVDVMVKFIAEINNELMLEVTDLDIGGGRGIYYTQGDDPTPIKEYSQAIFTVLKNKVNEYKLNMPKIYIEPGRSIIGPCGSNLYSVGSIKDIPGIRKYVAVDGGMSDNIRPALYGAKYEVGIGNRMNANSNSEVITISGKLCESGDILARDIELPIIESGDTLVMTSTGAYGYSMASNYNMIGKSAVVLVKDGKSDLIIKRQSYDDLMTNHIFLERLK